MKQNDQFRVLAVIRPRREGELDGGSSTVDRRLVETMRRAEGDGRDEEKRRGGSK